MKLKLFGFCGAIALALTCAFASCAPAVDPAESAVANLSALTVSAGTLTPSFDPAITEYAVDVESDVKSLTVAGTPEDAKATVSESGSAARSLAIGETAIVLTVTAENGTAKAYTVTAFRKPVVYAAGWYMADAKYTPCYWKGTERIDLDIPADRSYLDVTDIVVVDGSVYVSGYYKIDVPDGYPPYVAYYWKDGVRTDLATVDATTNTTTLGNAIVVSGGSVYVAGCYYPDDNAGNPAPCYWKDGVRTDVVSPGCDMTRVYDIAVEGDTVWLVGNDDTGDYMWKGSERIELPAEGYSYAMAIAIFEGRAWCAGRSSVSGIMGACVWENGVRRELTASGSSESRAIALGE